LPRQLKIKYNYKNNIHGRMPEKAHAHRGWPPMVTNNARAICKHQKKTYKK